MYNVGVFAGKFTPPHIGHIHGILHSATMCKKLYVVLSDSETLTKRLCEESNIPLMDMRQRMLWLSKELQPFPFIKVVILNETDIPEYPNGWEQWSKRLVETVPEDFDVLFGADVQYTEFNKLYFPDKDYVVYDDSRAIVPISGTEIRIHPLRNWRYLLKSSRHFFAKKILITGTESCGKTTLTQYLAKVYNTVCTEEEGRYYSQRYLGSNEDVFTKRDFERIAFQQYEKDSALLENSNRFAFFDSDATTTQYYLDLYLGEHSNIIDELADPSRYDLVFFMTPSVEWVDDGLRWNKETKLRWELHEKMKQMYINRGFGDKMIEVDGNYEERFKKCIDILTERFST